MDNGIETAEEYAEAIVEPTFGVRLFPTGDTFKLGEMMAELDDMMDVLLGRAEPPVDVGVATLMEVSDAYHARACEMEMAILQAEQGGSVRNGDRAYRFRTGQLRRFIELTKKSSELGSRRLTALQIMVDSGG